MSLPDGWNDDGTTLTAPDNSTCSGQCRDAALKGLSQPQYALQSDLDLAVARIALLETTVQTLSDGISKIVADLLQAAKDLVQ